MQNPTTYTTTTSAALQAERIQNEINESFVAYQLEMKREQRFNQLMKEIDTEAIDTFLNSKGLKISRCNVSNFCRPHQTKLTEEIINNAQLTFEYYLDATDFKAIKQCKFRGYDKSGSSLNDKKRSEKAEKFIAMVSEKFPILRIDTNQFCFESSRTDDNGYNIILSISTKL